MVKRIIGLCCTLIVISLSLIINASADTIYNKLQPGDIVIGRTLFRNTWISSNRAAVAGALYREVTEEIDIKTYKYVSTVNGKKIWYVLEDNNNYKLLSDREVEELENNLYINYNNNEPIVHTYNKEESVDFFDTFYGEKTYREIKADNEDFKIYENSKTLTCPYGLDFSFTARDTNNKITYYKGYCGLDDVFYFSMIDGSSSGTGSSGSSSINRVSIVDITTPQYYSSEKETKNYSNIINFKYRKDGIGMHFVNVGLFGKLEKFELYSKKGSWITLDIKLDGEKTSSLYTSSYIEYFVDSSLNIDNNTIRVHINADTLLPSQYINFIFTDSNGYSSSLHIQFNFYNENKIYLNTNKYERYDYSVSNGFRLINEKNYNEYYSLFYNKIARELYVSNSTYKELISCDDGLKLISSNSNSNYDLKDLSLIVIYKKQSYNYDYITRDKFLNFLTENDTLKDYILTASDIKIYYFFKDDITKEEQEHLEYLDSFSEVKLINGYESFKI